MWGSDLRNAAFGGFAGAGEVDTKPTSKVAWEPRS